VTEPARHLENEARILHFRRDNVGPGVHVAHVGLRHGESSLPHFHTTTRDTFYVMSGRLTVTVRPDPSRGPAYRCLCESPPEVQKEQGGRETHKIRLRPGDVLIIEPNVVHCAANVDAEACHFLCVEGIGDYDFIEADFR
jgi:quercetin dioxygenase-like cupin family protein